MDACCLAPHRTQTASFIGSLVAGNEGDQGRPPREGVRALALPGGVAVLLPEEARLPELLDQVAEHDLPQPRGSFPRLRLVRARLPPVPLQGLRGREGGEL